MIGKDVEQKRNYQNKWHREAYAKNPSKYKARSRARRAKFRGAINSQRRVNAAKKRDQAASEKWASYQVPAVSLPWNEQLRIWFEAQPMFSNVRALARLLSVTPRSVFDWLRGKHPPVGRRRYKLYEITELACFRVETRQKRPPQAALQQAPTIIRDLVVRCGLAPRDIQTLRAANVEQDGVRLPNGRLVRFGNKWEYVRLQPIETWISLAKPDEFLFFRQKPVDRGKPADRLWIGRQLRAAGIKMRTRQVGRMYHFAGDFLRMDSKKFLQHVRREHGLSRSGVSSLNKDLLKRKDSVAAGGAVERIDPEEAFSVLYPLKNLRGAGRKAKKTSIFAEAKRLHEKEQLSWPKIAKRLTPDDWAKDTRNASEAIRKGAGRL